MLEFIGLLAVFALVLLLSYLTARFVGKKFSGKAQNRAMKVIETLPLGLDRSLFLILVGKKYFLFLSSKKGLELVSEVEVDEMLEESIKKDVSTTNVFDFKKIFESYSGLSYKKETDKSAINKQETVEQKTEGILGNIRRLKKINGDRDLD